VKTLLTLLLLTCALGVSALFDHDDPTENNSSITAAWQLQSGNRAVDDLKFQKESGKPDALCPFRVSPILDEEGLFSKNGPEILLVIVEPRCCRAISPLAFWDLWNTIPQGNGSFITF